MNKKKQGYTFRVDNSSLAEEWYESFKRACAFAKSATIDAGDALEPSPRVHFDKLESYPK